MKTEVKKYLSDESEKLYKDKISECESHIKKQSRRIKDLESQLKERDELLERIFKYHISHGFGDDGSFESFADEITDII